MDFFLPHAPIWRKITNFANFWAKNPDFLRKKSFSAEIGPREENGQGLEFNFSVQLKFVFFELVKLGL